MEKENVDNKLNLRENNSYTNQEKMKAELDACYSKIDYVTQNCNELDKKLYV
ncbi:hypothetical protein A3Q56_08288 [Intoshia linei]|uniref:Uncharacterized protein n=2 Tax=Intoshia linei TaxID=1819745 RepID=A0A177APR1_9BILA|nr:hypothetical protein A3Q56_08288 [Intoshia linei]